MSSTPPITETWDIPRHVAIIMDGNGRWARERGMSRNQGHEAGAESVREIVRACGELGVEVLTLYSFSTENWGRPEDEVESLMALLARYLREETSELMDNDVRLNGIGQIDRMPVEVRTLIAAAESMTAGNQGLRLLLALSYGARAELVQAVRSIAEEVVAGQITPSSIDEATIAGQLYTAGLPDPDLVIRTSGDQRVSNFLLWQIAYSELYITTVPWPEFRRNNLEDAFMEYTSRQRRYGRTGEQSESTA